MAIKWDFVSEREGGQQLTGYVPAVEVSESGVTVATGVDLGQRSKSSIDALPIPDDLKAKLKPYAGLKTQVAVDVLARSPLTITQDEADALDRAIKQGRALGRPRALRPGRRRRAGRAQVRRPE